MHSGHFDNRQCYNNQVHHRVRNYRPVEELGAIYSTFWVLNRLIPVCPDGDALKNDHEGPHDVPHSRSGEQDNDWVPDRGELEKSPVKGQN